MWTWQEVIDKLVNNLTPEQLQQPASIQVNAMPGCPSYPVVNVDIEQPKIITE